MMLPNHSNFNKGKTRHDINMKIKTQNIFIDFNILFTKYCTKYIRTRSLWKVFRYKNDEMDENKTLNLYKQNRPINTLKDSYSSTCLGKIM